LALKTQHPQQREDLRNGRKRPRRFYFSTPHFVLAIIAAMFIVRLPLSTAAKLSRRAGHGVGVAHGVGSRKVLRHNRKTLTTTEESYLPVSIVKTSVSEDSATVTVALETTTEDGPTGTIWCHAFAVENDDDNSVDGIITTSYNTSAVFALGEHATLSHSPSPAPTDGKFNQLFTACSIF
jgi:hypothetical protein